MASESEKRRRRSVVIAVVGVILLGLYGLSFWTNDDQPAGSGNETVHWSLPAGQLGNLTITPPQGWDNGSGATREVTYWADFGPSCKDGVKCPAFYLDVVEGWGEDCEDSSNPALCTREPGESPIEIEAARMCGAVPADLVTTDVGIGDRSAMFSMLSDCRVQNGAEMYWWYVESEDGSGLLITAYDPDHLLEGAGVATEVFEDGTWSLVA